MFRRGDTASFLKGAFKSSNRSDLLGEDIFKFQQDNQEKSTGNLAVNVTFTNNNKNSLQSNSKLTVAYEPNRKEKLSDISNAISVKMSELKKLLNLIDEAPPSDEVKNIINEIYSTFREAPEKKFFYKLFWRAGDPILNNKSPIVFLKNDNSISSLRLVMSIFRKSFKE